jgi:hypothetical protein
MDTLINDEQLIGEARRLGIWIGNPGREKRHLRHLIEQGILPSRVAVREPKSKAISWLFPPYAVDCLKVYKDSATHPLEKIAEMLRPLMKFWHARWEAERALRGEAGSLDALEVAPFVIAIKDGLDTKKLESVCENEGLPRKQFNAILIKAVKDRVLRPLEMAQLEFILRRTARLYDNDPQRASLLLKAADLLQLRLDLAEDKP